MTTRASWQSPPAAWSIVVHGGAGDAPPGTLEPRTAAARRAAEIGARVLRDGGTSLDAVMHAALAMEDEPLFNAGTGGALNEEGRIELDASLMEGTTLRFGGVCALSPFLHPIAVARAVLEDGDHVLYAGEGAARFARAHGFTDSTHEAMTTALAKERWAAGQTQGGTIGADRNKGGTVGAVARDTFGRVAAATSTGGRNRKRVGRVGDSPIPGAGTYADDEAGACSSTGHGEAFLRLCAAKEAVELLRMGRKPEDVARACVQRVWDKVQGEGGLIVVDREGRLGWARTSLTMTWAALAAGWAETKSGD